MLGRNHSRMSSGRPVAPRVAAMLPDIRLISGAHVNTAYVSLSASSPTDSALTRRSGGRGPAKYGLPGQAHRQMQSPGSGGWQARLARHGGSRQLERRCPYQLAGAILRAVGRWLPGQKRESWGTGRERMELPVPGSAASRVCAADHGTPRRRPSPRVPRVGHLARQGDDCNAAYPRRVQRSPAVIRPCQERWLPRPGRLSVSTEIVPRSSVHR